MQLAYPKKLFTTIVFKFSWDNCNSNAKLETMVMENLGGGGVGGKGALLSKY